MKINVLRMRPAVMKIAVGNNEQTKTAGNNEKPWSDG